MKMAGTIRVAGETIQLETFDLMISDVSRGMEEVASQCAYVAALWAEAERERVLADAAYRQWRAKYGKELRESDPKMAVAKVDDEIESSPGFSTCKEAIAITEKNATLLKALFESFKIKANALQSRGAMIRAEIESDGMTTRERSTGAERGDDEAALPATPSDDRGRIRGLATGGKKPKKTATAVE